jgi:hypothetical protein
MRPRVLGLNFVNGRTNADMQALFQQIFAGLAEGSRYHGYSDPSAPPFFAYQVVRSVDLTDHPPPAGWTLKNSTRYPRKPASSTDYWHFDYHALFTQTFADAYGFADPANPGRNLTLCELVEQGIVHEIWVYGDADVPDVNAAEVLENKQRYGADGKAIPGSFDPCAGNGCFDPADVPTCKVSVRIPWVNNTRGPGCLMHSLGHGFEGMSKGAIPYLVDNFTHFADFDLDKTHPGTPFSSWYACSLPNCVTFTGSDALTWNVNGQTGTMSPYGGGCGSVHFPPNARAHYDDQNAFGVLSTCEHYGLHDGPGGKDMAVIYTDAKSQMYDALEPDCEGGWQVYFRQSFPGLGNKATGADMAPMKNWWPYEYY